MLDDLSSEKAVRLESEINAREVFKRLADRTAELEARDTSTLRDRNALRLEGLCAMVESLVR